MAAVYPQGERAYTFNQSLMELGATVCVPNGAPKCSRCPLQPWCLAYANQSWDVLPQKEAKKKRRIEEKTLFVLRCGDAVAVQKRPNTGLWPSCGSFPIQRGHLTAQQALDQAAAWEVQPLAIERMETGKHIFTHVEWHMTCYYLQCSQQSPLFVWADRTAMERERLPCLPPLRFFWPNVFLASCVCYTIIFLFLIH